MNLGTSQSGFFGGVSSTLSFGRMEDTDFVGLFVDLTLIFYGGVPFS